MNILDEIVSKKRLVFGLLKLLSTEITSVKYRGEAEY